MIKRRARNKYKISLKTVMIIVVIILISICIFCKFYLDKAQAVTESDWVNVELHYIGSAKTDYKKEEKIYIDNDIRTDDELTYTYSYYYFLRDYFDYQIEDQWYKFYDPDFEPKFALENGKDRYYVFSRGRKLEWLQYNPNKISQFGGVMNRAGKEWDAEIEEDMVYFYEFEYSGEYLARVEMEF